DARPLDVEGDVEVVGLLVKEVAGVGALVAAGAVVGAAHVGPRPDPLVRPAVPLAVGVEAHRGDGGLPRAGGLGRGRCGQTPGQRGAEECRHDRYLSLQLPRCGRGQDENKLSFHTPSSEAISSSRVFPAAYSNSISAPLRVPSSSISVNIASRSAIRLV